MISRKSTLRTDPSCIHIGLVNNMPDSALEATERQFQTLLFEAAEGIAIHLSLFALPDVPRRGKAQCRISSSYSSLSALWNENLDGLIVTGAEPVNAKLTDEPYWNSLTRVIDWAEHNTYSSIWSCLAAHAAVLKMDGIERRPLSDKRFGVFESAKVSDHPLVAGIPAHIWMPHSRWNDIPEHALSASGYRVLTQSKDRIVDMFIKQGRSLFVFFQGHPEYEADSLLLEYRRDIRRFLARDRSSYPSVPQSYFDEDTAADLRALQQKAVRTGSENCLTSFPDSALRVASLKSIWHTDAVRLYRNWLRYLSNQKMKGVEAKPRRIGYESRESLAAMPGHANLRADAN